jgi:Flp pilus assembly protein TadD
MRGVVCVLFAVAAAACGAGRSANHLPAVDLHRPQSPAPEESLGSFIGKTRELQARAPATQTPVPGGTLETFDTELGGALLEAQLQPSGVAARRVATAYARYGVFDMAHQYLMAAVKVDPKDAANYEALARLWRDAGFPHLAVSDAHRAVYYAPNWPVAHNTLGTVLQAIGLREAARLEYQRAFAQDNRAAYALNNLCYTDILDGRISKAVQRCQDAVALDPQLRAAQNNLGIAYAATGRMDDALKAFSVAVDHAGALYNLGIMRMARKEYGSAVEAFQAAQTSKPSFPLAAARLEQARARVASGEKR